MIYAIVTLFVLVFVFAIYTGAQMNHLAGDLSRLRVELAKTNKQVRNADDNLRDEARCLRRRINELDVAVDKRFQGLDDFFQIKWKYTPDSREYVDLQFEGEDE